MGMVWEKAYVRTTEACRLGWLAAERESRVATSPVSLSYNPTYHYCFLVRPSLEKPKSPRREDNVTNIIRLSGDLLQIIFE